MLGFLLYSSGKEVFFRVRYALPGTVAAQVYKRHTELPRRAWNIWAMDTFLGFEYGVQAIMSVNTTCYFNKNW